MRNLVTAILIPAVCLSLAADTTGRIAGKVLGKDGKPVAGATVLLTRNDITWSKELRINDKGAFFQVGLEPKEFTLNISAPGYQSYKEELKIPLGETYTKDYTLLTTKEATEEAIKAGKLTVSASATKATSGSAAFNSAVEFYNKQEYGAALPLLEKSVTDLRDGIAAAKDGDAEKKTMEGQLATAERVYGISLFEVGRTDPAKKDLVLKAEPLLAAASDRNPKDPRLLLALLDVSKAKDDAAGIAKYQAAVDAVIGPRPELAYNEGVTAFNAEKYKEAKVLVKKAIAADPKFPESYWLLGVVEFALGDSKAAKEAFKHYLEIAPTGKKAGEVKEFLKELR